MTVSPTMRRYAAEIYRLQEDNEQVPLSLLSEHVDTSAQAISTMVKRLSKSGYLIHEPYRGVKSDSGRQENRHAFPAASSTYRSVSRQSNEI